MPASDNGDDEEYEDFDTDMFIVDEVKNFWRPGDDLDVPAHLQPTVEYYGDDFEPDAYEEDTDEA